MSRWVAVYYKCCCLQDERLIHVRERGPQEHVVDWMEHVRNQLNDDHTARSPECQATNMEYCKFQVGDNQRIGGAQGGTA